MAYLKKLSSLEDMARCQLAINLCQDNSFKEIAMCLKKPISDSVSWSFSNLKQVEMWDTAIDEQCQRLTEGLPYFLKHGIRVWISRIALEYLSCSRRMELLFKIPRNIFMNILTRQDWTETGRINEKRVAKRLLQDERLTVLKRYRIACIYCLYNSIPHLWSCLTSEEKYLISGNDDPHHSQEKNALVLLWSYFMDGHREENVTQQRNNLWTYAAVKAVDDGNLTAFIQCWKNLDKHTRRHIVMHRALQSLEKWKQIRNKDRWREELVSNENCGTFVQSEPIGRFNLPSYYSELLRFFLSIMSERRQLKFFSIAIEISRANFNYGDPNLSILDCFSEWPLQEYFLPTVNRLWGTIPNDMYGQCLLSLARKYSQAYDRLSSSASFYKKENLYYDYRNILWNLWKDTPEEYKQYVIFYKKINTLGRYTKTVIEQLLPQLLTQSPLHEKDVALFKQVWHYLPQEERKAVLYDRDIGNICLILVEKEMWSFINWLFEGSFTALEISSFKLKLAKSNIIRISCFNKLEENCGKFVEGFIDWAFESDTDKVQFKYEIIKNEGVNNCSYLFRRGKYIEMERIINFCLSSEKTKLQFKVDIVKQTCNVYLKDCAWGQMDKSIAWIFDAEEKINHFKKDLFYSDYSVLRIHHKLVFNPSPQWEKVERFYRWFCLSAEEIKKLKRETAFTSHVIDVVHRALCGNMNEFYERVYGEFHVLVRSLCWCLTDEEMVISFREEIEKRFLEVKGSRYNKNPKKGKEQLDYLVSELLQNFRKNVDHCKAGEENYFWKDKERKRCLMIDNKSCSRNKRF